MKLNSTVMFVAVAIGLVDVGGGRALAETNGFVWGKTAASAAALESDSARCAEEAKSVKAGTRELPLDVHGLANIWEQAIVQHIDDVALRRAYLSRCLHKLGWRPVPLTAEENSSLKAASTSDARSHWEDGFFARADFANRLQATATMPLPEISGGSAVYGPMRIDLDKLVPTPGVVKSGDTLLKAPAEHLRTARVTAGATLSVLNGARFEAGTTLYAARLMHWGQERSFWCGPIKAGHFTLRGCVRNDEDWGFVAAVGQGPTWAVSSTDQDAFDPDLALNIEPSDHDLVGHFDVYLVVRNITATDVRLEAVLNYGKEWEDIWAYSLPFDSNGRAVLPFWSRRLVLTRAGDGVSTNLEDGGDGTGWPWSPAKH
ncbi:MAG TPA: hypothetical protein VHY34_13090 [Caulobacteraceae bacterium]|nr:hypothetical protein [Caulobacteraceae bacterium]